MKGMQLRWYPRNSHSESNFNNKPALTIHKHARGMSKVALRQADLGAKYSTKPHWQSQLRISEALQKEYDTPPRQSNASEQALYLQSGRVPLSFPLKSLKGITEPKSFSCSCCRLPTEGHSSAPAWYPSHFIFGLQIQTTCPATVVVIPKRGLL